MQRHKKRWPEARLKEGRPCKHHDLSLQLHPWTFAIKLLTKSSQFGTHGFLRHKPFVFPFAWQINKAILFYFTQSSVSEIRFGTGAEAEFLASFTMVWLSSFQIFLATGYFLHKNLIYKLVKPVFHYYTFIRRIQFCNIQFSSVQFSHSVVSDSLRPHESQHARPPCLSTKPNTWLYK